MAGSSSFKWGIFLPFLRLTGMAPFMTTKNNVYTKSKFWQYYSLFPLFFVTYSAVLINTSLRVDSDKKFGLSTLFSVLDSIGYPFSAVFAIITIAKKHHSLIATLNQISKFHVIFNSYEINVIKMTDFRLLCVYYALEIMINVLATIDICLRDIIKIDSNVFIFIAFLMSNEVTGATGLNFSLFAFNVKDLFQKLNICLRKNKSVNNKSSINYLRRAHFDLCDLVAGVNGIFSEILFVSVAVEFGGLVFQLYRIENKDLYDQHFSNVFLFYWSIFYFAKFVVKIIVSWITCKEVWPASRPPTLCRNKEWNRLMSASAMLL